MLAVQAVEAWGEGTDRRRIASGFARHRLGEGTPSRGMAGQKPYPSLEALRKLEASLNDHLCDQHGWADAHDDAQVHDDAYVEPVPPPVAKSRRWFARRDPLDRRMRIMLLWPRMRKLVLVGGTLGGLALIG